MRIRPILSLVLAACSAAAAAPKADAADVGAASGGGFQFVLENDLFARGRTDRWYTNGLRLSVQRPKPSDDEPIARGVLSLGDALLGRAVDKDAGAERSVVWSLGQIIYTPRGIERARPQRGDRPWAGWLYAGAAVQGFKDDRFQQTELKLGCTGACSGAGQAQRWWHEVINSPYPAGWEQQLDTRVGLQLSHLRLWRLGNTQLRDRIGLHGGGAAVLGHMRNYATVMGGVVIGDLQGDNPVFALSNEGDLAIQDFGESAARRKLIFFANLSGTAVASNRFLTGSTPYGRAEIELRRWVGAWQWGVSIPLFSPHWQLVFSQTSRTSEFTSPLYNRKEGVQRWGSLMLTRSR